MWRSLFRCPLTGLAKPGHYIPPNIMLSSPQRRSAYYYIRLLYPSVIIITITVIIFCTTVPLKVIHNNDHLSVNKVGFVTFLSTSYFSRAKYRVLSTRECYL